MKHFSELTHDEVEQMWSACVDAAIQVAEDLNMSGLSEAGSHNIYRALEEALHSEHVRSKQRYKTAGKIRKEEVK